jgi:hypothetical protein
MLRERIFSRPGRVWGQTPTAVRPACPRRYQPDVLHDSSLQWGWIGIPTTSANGLRVNKADGPGTRMRPLTRPAHRRAERPNLHGQHLDHACHRAPPGHVPRQQSRQADQSRGQRSLSHLGAALRPRTAANRSAPSPAHPLTASRSLTTLQQLQDAGHAWAPSQVCPCRLGRDGRWRENCIRTGRHDGSYLHRHLETKAAPSPWRK